LELKDILTNEDMAVGSYRFFISSLIPQMTQVALKIHKKDIIRETPNYSKKEFIYRLSRSSYEREWGKTYAKPGPGTVILAAILRYIPKAGPLKGLGFNNPTPQTEDLYIKSIDTTTDRYRSFLDDVRSHKLVLLNRDLDSGEASIAGEYSLADEAYADLLSELSSERFLHTSPQLRDNIEAFYSDRAMPIKTDKDTKRRQNVLDDLDQLRSAPLQPQQDKR
jgi:hypothetical protein